MPADRLDRVVEKPRRSAETDVLIRHDDLSEDTKSYRRVDNPAAVTVPEVRDDYSTQAPHREPQSKAGNSSVELDAGKWIGDDLEVLGELGKGGMGAVYRAYQHSLKRHVAVKMISGSSLRSAAEVARFRIEAEAAARLNHPGIVPIQGVGEWYGTHYYVMALVEGGSLEEYVHGETRLTPRRAAAVIQQVCRAVQYAHDHAVIHRDIKPANILLENDGCPKLTDFGLAKVLDGKSDLTVAGQVMGTPSYMAPEQAFCTNAAVSNRSDVYSLGATLYALLAGKPPFSAATVHGTLQKVLTAAPETLSNEVPADLQVIILKCLAKNPNDRYESAAALADDLQRFLKGYPIAARPASAWLKTLRWCQRNPGVAALLVLVATTFAAGSIVSTAFAIEASRQAATAREALAAKEKNAQKLNEAIEETFIFASENLLADEPGMQAARKTLLENAQRYYQELIATGQGSEEKVAQAAFLLGRVQASLGDNPGAAASFNKALSIQNRLLTERQADAQLLAALANTHNEYARLAERIWHDREIGRARAEAEQGLKAWREHAEQCVRWRTKAVEAATTDVELQRLLANAWMNLGLAYLEEGRVRSFADEFRAADRLLHQAQALRNQLLLSAPEDGKLLRDLALGFGALADLRIVEAELKTDNAAQRRLWQESLEMRMRAAQTLSDLPLRSKTQETDLLLATCYQSCGESHFNLGLAAEAIADYEKMLQVMKRLLVQNPRVYRYRSGVAEGQFNLCQLLLASGDARGYAVFRECQQTLSEGVAVDPRNDEALDGLVNYTQHIAQGLGEQGMYAEAIEQLKHARELLAELHAPASNKMKVEAADKKLSQQIELQRKAAATKRDKTV